MSSAYPSWLFGRRYLLLQGDWGYLLFLQKLLASLPRCSGAGWGPWSSCIMGSLIPGFPSLSDKNNGICQPFKCLETSSLSWLISVISVVLFSPLLTLYVYFMCRLLYSTVTSVHLYVPCFTMAASATPSIEPVVWLWTAVLTVMPCFPYLLKYLTSACGCHCFLPP